MTNDTTPPGFSAGDATSSGDAFDPSQPLFDLGLVRVTPGVLDLGITHVDMATLVAMHSLGLWGDVDEHDSLLNNLNTVGGDGGRVLSAYTLTDAHDEPHRVWVSTDAEDDEGVRASTVIMLPSEY